ncbi:MAG: MFS transporter [Alphaproteobacteria bacterium]
MSGFALSGHDLALAGRRRAAVLGALPALVTVAIHGSVLDLPRADVVDALDADRYRIYWIIGAWLLGNATGMASTAFFRDRFGLRRTMVGAMLVFALASSACAATASVVQMAPLRLLGGYSAGLVLCSSMLVLWREFPHDTELPMTLYGMGVWLSTLAGSIAGGLLVATFGWRSLFLVQFPLGLLAAGCAADQLPDDRPVPGSAAPSFDVIGLAVLASWVGTMVPVFVLGHYWGWFDSPWFTPFGIAFGLATAAFVAWGTLSARPIVDLRPLAHRNFGLGLVVKAALALDVTVLVSLLSGWMIGARGYQWWQGSLVFLPALLAMALAMVAGARFGRDRDRKARIFVGLAVASAVTWHVAHVDLYTYKVLVAAWLAAWGAGAGLAIGPIMLTIFEGLPRETLGHAAGTFNIFRALPVFAVGTLLVVFHAMQGDAHFDRLRLAVTRDRPIVSATRSSIERRLASHGVPPERRTAQAHAVLAGWVGRNAAAFALEDVLRVLALVTAAALLVVPWLDPPPASRRGAASS